MSVWKVEEPSEDSAAVFNVTNEPKLLCETNYTGDVTDIEVCKINLPTDEVSELTFVEGIICKSQKQSLTLYKLFHGDLVLYLLV